MVALNWNHDLFQIQIWRIAGLKNDVKFVMNAQIGDFVKVEDDDVVEMIDHLDVRVVLEFETLVEMVECDDKVVRDVRRFDVMVENDDVEEVQTIATVVDDDDEVVVDDYIETVVIDEPVDIMDQVKLMVENDEKVEIPDCLDVLEMVVKNETLIHEMGEKVVIDEIDESVVIDKVQTQEHETHREFDEKEFCAVEMVGEWIDHIVDEPVETQSRTFIDSIWTQGIFGINASMQDDEMVEMGVALNVEHLEMVETGRTVDKWLFLMIP